MVNWDSNENAVVKRITAAKKKGDRKEIKKLRKALKRVRKS